jgi:hypothetical protein
MQMSMKCFIFSVSLNMVEESDGVPFRMFGQNTRARFSAGIFVCFTICHACLGGRSWDEIELRIVHVEENATNMSNAIAKQILNHELKGIFHEIKKLQIKYK